MAVVKDVVESAALTVAGTGTTATRLFVVSDLAGAPESRTARASFAPGIPQVGTPHPAVPGLVVESIGVACKDPETYFVTVNYKYPSGSGGGSSPGSKAQISGGANAQTVQTNLDAKGRLMEISYAYKTGTDDAPGSVVKTQTGEVQIQVPMPVLRFTRREKLDPFDKIKKYVGKINGGAFRGDEKHYWLCSAIDFQSQDGGKTYDVTYEFIRNENTWSATVLYIDPTTGQPPSPEQSALAPEVPNGVAQFDVYPEANFGGLNL